MLITLIIPVYNEEESLLIFYETVNSNTFLQNYELEMLFINDGSNDKTEQLVLELSQSDPKISLISFSRNFGKESALFAGIEYARGDVVIPIDVDLQDPIDVIPELIRKYEEGYDVVLAKRVDRSSDSFLKRFTAEGFYKLHNKISDPKIEENVGDFRLMSRKVVEAIKQLPEKKLFMKGILSWVGFKTAIVEYKREERVAGATKFNGWKLWNLALEGITSFSTWPLRVWTYLGFTVASISFLLAIWRILSKMLFGNNTPGYSSLMVAILFLGGIQLIGIGVLGEYIGRIYTETKNRPRYIIDQIVRKTE